MNLTVYYENEQNAIPVTYKLKMLIRRAIEETLAYEQYGNDVEVSVTHMKHRNRSDISEQKADRYSCLPH